MVHEVLDVVIHVAVMWNQVIGIVIDATLIVKARDGADEKGATHHVQTNE